MMLSTPVQRPKSPLPLRSTSPLFRPCNSAEDVPGAGFPVAAIAAPADETTTAALGPQPLLSMPPLLPLPLPLVAGIVKAAVRES